MLVCSLRQFVPIENMSDLLGVPLGYIYRFSKDDLCIQQIMPSKSNGILDPTGSDYGFISCTETAQAYGRDVQHGGF